MSFAHIVSTLFVFWSNSVLALDGPHAAIDGYPAGSCAPCHDIHDPDPPTATEICQTCHSAAWTVVPATVVANHAGSSEFAFTLACTACHDPHFQAQDALYGTTYGMYVKTTISEVIEAVDLGATPDEPYTTVVDADIVFTSNLEFDDGDGDPSNDICNVCHTRTDYHTNDSTGGHWAGTDCTRCHGHGTGFLRDAPGPGPGGRR